LRHGINDYTSWFANNRCVATTMDTMDRARHGNSLIHHYIFTLHAIDLPRLEMHGVVNAQSEGRGDGGFDRHLLPQSSAEAKLMFAVYSTIRR
jgi:phosphatidylethanolamine-binding protein (PEBP) family uncharacterized protein